MNTNHDNRQQQQVIISLTSFPAAIPYAIGAIKSVLSGSVLPDKVVLYVTLSQFSSGHLPEELTRLAEENPRFEIRDYPVDIRSYRKLIPALADFPDAVIVTIDDDVAYSPNMLRDLLRVHEHYPLDVIAHRAKRILPDRPYRKWPKYRWYTFLTEKWHPSFANIQTGVGGVLYPSGALKADMLDPELFTALAPTTDDIWFWGAAVANGRRIVPVPFGANKPRSLGKPRELSLKTVNFKSGTDRNTPALRAMLEKYPEIASRLRNGK